MALTLTADERAELERRVRRLKIRSEDARRARVILCSRTAIQALDRLDPVLPLSPGRAERHGFEYYSITATAHSRCWPRSTRSRARCSARQSRGTPARRSSTSLATL